MSRKAKTNGSTALATITTAPSALQITRADANARIKTRALELYHGARTQRDERIRAFEAEYGRADRIDNSVLADLQRTQARLAAIAARQRTSAPCRGPEASGGGNASDRRRVRCVPSLVLAPRKEHLRALTPHTRGKGGDGFDTKP